MDNRSNALAPWGGRKEIRELATRLQMTMPGAGKLTGGEAAALAQVAIAHELDPFNGEIWLIKGKDGKTHGLMIGIKGLRKLARKQLDREADRAKISPATLYPPVLERIPSVEYGAGEKDIVYRCHLRDSVTMGAWLKSLIDLKAGFKDVKQLTNDDIEAMLGPTPVTIGVGIYRAGEMTKMEPDECARKRAEANAIKQRFDVDFANMSDEEPEAIVDAEFREIKDDEGFLPAERKPQTTTQAKEELGFSGGGGYNQGDNSPDKPGDRISDIETLAQQITDLAHQASQRGTINVTPGMRGLLVGTLMSIFGDKIDRYLFCEALTGHKSSKDIPEEYVIALLEFFGLRWDEEGHAPRPADAKKESVDLARRVLRSIHKAAGQTEMPA